MTDAEKLQRIETIAREAFADKWQGEREQVITAHRLQALANIFAIFEYNGLTCTPAGDHIENQKQISINDL